MRAATWRFMSKGTRCRSIPDRTGYGKPRLQAAAEAVAPTALPVPAGHPSRRCKPWPRILSGTAAPQPLPDRPSIAVLPFNNVSGDPEQEYFVDGITEDIITALSKWRWFLVIARNSTFAYKGKPVDLKEVGRDLGVRYVLETSSSIRSSPTLVGLSGRRMIEP
jgi:adenylate cyclase